MSDGGPAPGAQRPVAPWWPLLVVALAWAAQGGVLSGDWLHDDAAVRTASGGPGAGPSLGRALSPDAWADTLEAGAWRPAASVSLALEAPLWERLEGEGQAFGFRVTNLLLHGVVSLLLFAVLARWLPGRPVLVVGGAVLFAAHPAQAPVIAALAGRADLLALVFSLGAALAWSAAGPGRRAWLPVAALAWFLALLSKETALGLPAVLLLADAARARAGGERWSRRAALSGVFLVPLVLWLVSRPAGGAADGPLTEVTVGERAVLGLASMGQAAVRLALPVGLLQEPVRPGASGAATAPETWLAVAALLLSLGAVVRAALGRAGPLSLAWLACALLALAGALLAPVAVLATPRFPYVPAAPLFLAGGVLAAGLLRPPVPRRLGVVGASLAVLALVVLARAESAPWRGNLEFEEAVLAADPSNAGAHLAIARELLAEAQSSLERSSALPAESPERIELMSLGTAALERARDHARAATQAGEGRTDPAAWATYGAVLLARRELPEAEYALERSLALDPALSGAGPPPAGDPPRRAADRAMTYYRLGVVHEGLGQLEQAAFRFEYAAGLRPDDPRFTEKAGAALARVLRFGDAIPWLERALKTSASEATRARISRILTETRAASGSRAIRALREAQAAEDVADYATARDQYESAILADPSRVEAYLGAARIQGTTFGQYRIARDRLAEAERRIAGLPEEARNAYAERLRNVRALVDAQERRDLEEEEREFQEAEGKPGPK